MVVRSVGKKAAGPVAVNHFMAFVVAAGLAVVSIFAELKKLACGGLRDEVWGNTRCNGILKRSLDIFKRLSVAAS